MEVWEKVQEILVGILITGGVPVLAYVIGTLAVMARAKLAEAKDKADAAGKSLQGIGYEMADKVLESVTRITVGKLESTKAAELRKKVQAGENDWEELRKVSDTALQEILEQLKPEVKQILLTNVGDLDAYIRNRIEAVLPEVKADYAEAQAKEQEAKQKAMVTVSVGNMEKSALEAAAFAAAAKGKAAVLSAGAAGDVCADGI